MSLIEFKKDYESLQKSMFLNGKIGLIENTKKEFPKIWYYYKLLKSLDWDENEVDISSCRNEFKSVDPYIKDLLIKTLAWQFEADSLASLSPNAIIPIISSPELLCYIYENMKNEALHSLAYKVIVENTFEDPTIFFKELLKMEDTFKRLNKVKEVLEKIDITVKSYSIGKEVDISTLKRSVFLYWASMLALERIQFMSSFAITFGLAENSYFIPIAKLVQKICTDEFQVHIQVDKEVLNNELNIEENFSYYIDVIDDIKNVIRDVVLSEVRWLDYLFGDRKHIFNISKNDIRKFIMYSATEVCEFLNIKVDDVEIVTTNPLEYMNKWIVIDSNQASPQEESVVNYLLGRFKDDSNLIDISKYSLSFPFGN